MARLLNATSYWSSVLAAACLVLALMAAPIGQARADDPIPIPQPANCLANCTETDRVPPCTNCVCNGGLCPSDCQCADPVLGINGVCFCHR